MSTAQRWLLAVIAAAAAVACFVGAVVTCSGCTPAEVAQVAQDAKQIGPELNAACGLAPDTGPAAPYVELICVGAEAADAALAKLPQGTAAIVATNAAPVLAIDASMPAARLPLYRLRILLAQTTAPRVVAAHPPLPPPVPAPAPIVDAGGQ